MGLLKEARDISTKELNDLAKQGECVVVCYNHCEVWQSRAMASEFYLEGMYACDGAERERYTNVFLDLMSGSAIAHDGVTEYITRETEYR